MTTEHNPYEYHDNLIKGAEENRKAREQKVDEGWKAYNDNIQKKVEEDQKIIDRASEIYLKEERRKREAEAERQRQEATQQAEKQAESALGIKSEKTKQIDDAWKEMISDFTFED